LWAIGFKIVLVAILDSFLHYRHKRKKHTAGYKKQDVVPFPSFMMSLLDALRLPHAVWVPHHLPTVGP
jgi:hypothetical protein